MIRPRRSAHELDDALEQRARTFVPAVSDFLLLIVISLLTRLAFLPLATQDSGDHTARIFIAWRWIQDPILMFSGIWPPLHFFIIGPVIKAFQDASIAPVILHLGIGSMSPGLLYVFAGQEFRDRRAAFAVGLAYALYPLGIRTSLEVMAQAPFVLCLGVALICLSKARSGLRAYYYSALAGLATTLSCGFRIEGWLLIPFLAFTLLPLIRAAALFVAIAVVWPALSIVESMAFYGVPLLRLEDVANTLAPLQDRIALAIGFLAVALGAVTPILSALAIAGVVLCVVERRPQAIWIVPLVGITGSMIGGVVRGSILTDTIYSEPIGLFLIPFLAGFLTCTAFRGLRPNLQRGLYAVLFGSMMVFLAVGAARVAGLGGPLGRVVAAIPAVSPAPTFRGASDLTPLLERLTAELREGDALLLDPMGPSPAAAYLAVHSRIHPYRIYIPSSDPDADYSAESESRDELWERRQPFGGNYPSELNSWLTKNCSGLVILQTGSRFAEFFGYQPPDHAVLDGIETELTPLAHIDWLPIIDARRRDSHSPIDMTGQLTLFRYEAAPCRH